ncbi:hypothetical protein TNCV_3525331 [Trichonephila clavipes]|uniref:Uncharacterized protein n=1 Tax=Trichonephila clavipes TaxID=2585209 RepID=A0A8X6S386_TRICX|nr:hypothetical protein TNCV_3525331 [Trichonephila clavipes]
MRARVYCTHPSTHDHWALKCMSRCLNRTGGQSEERPPVFKSPSKLGTHLSTHCSRDERLNRPCLARNKTRTCGVEARYATIRPLGLLAKLAE